MLAHLLLPVLLAASPASPARPAAGPALQAAAARASAALLARHGQGQGPRIARGVAQVLAAWRPEDGDTAALQTFLEEQFVADPGQLDALLGRFEEALEALEGGAVEQNRALARHAVLELGPLLPVDRLLAAHDAGAHLTDDLFASRLAFVALLNFPAATPAERERESAGWSRRRWAEDRLTKRFFLRVPAAVNQRQARAAAEADLYIASRNVYLHHVLVDGQRLFPEGMRLLSHWNLRDQIKADYAAPGGLARQRAIAQVMRRIVTQTVPAAVMDSPLLDWDPFTNAVSPAPAETIEGGAPPPARADPAREPDTRYARLLENFRAARAEDAFTPALPTAIARKFDHERELSEARVEQVLRQILESPLVPRVARLVEQRLGRKLEPFDVWYDGFRPRARFSEAELDRLTRQRYPTAEAFQKDLPRILARLGFAPDKAQWLAEHVLVEPARGSGHALGAGRRGDLPHLRTRVGPEGMDYKGFNIAVHELGHNVEQAFSLYEVDSTLVRGVPNNAFTEALAFVFQARDLDVLELPARDPADAPLLAVNDLWMTWEVAGVSLVDLQVWRWLYAHPQASPAQLREATLAIAREVWNRHFAPVLGGRDCELLGIYSHMIAYPLYLADYTIGHLIAAQVEEHLRQAPALGPEFERMARFGAVTPDAWMVNATGAPVGAGPLLEAAARGLDQLQAR